jgi:hypothetical protein
MTTALVWALAALLGGTAVFLAVTDGFVGQDAHAYWATRDGGLYDSGPQREDAYLYSPAFALAIWPLVQLPWWLFLGTWVALQAAALSWLLQPLPTRWAVPAGLFALTELVLGNVFLLLAAMVALGLRQPAAWSFGVLTKITPGVGLLWFAGRSEWRSFRTGVAVLALVALVSRAVTPAWWSEWARFLLGYAGESDPTFLPRCLLAALVVLYAARTGRAWLLAPAVLVACPLLTSFSALTVLLAIPQLLRSRRADDSRTKGGQDQGRSADSPAGRPETVRTDVPLTR